MCGFIGKISYSNFNPEILNNNNKLIECRGPDSKIIKSDLDSNIKYCFIFNRLSILDLSENANQPMINEHSGNQIMFNGEIYNHSELRSMLSKKGVKKNVWRSNLSSFGSVQECKWDPFQPDRIFMCAGNDIVVSSMNSSNVFSTALM